MPRMPRSTPASRPSMSPSAAPTSGCARPALRRRLRRCRRHPLHQRRRRRHRSHRLGRDAAAHVPALGGAARLRRREILDRLEGEEAGIKSATVDGPRPARLRLPARRARRPPPGAHQPLRLRRSAATPRSPGGGAARGGRRRSRSTRSPTTTCEVDTYRAPGRRRPARQQDRFGGAADPPAHGHRGPVPERALASTRTASWP